VLNAGSGGDTYASDDITGVKFQRVKVVHGADGVNAGDVATGNPLPTVQTGALPAGTNNIGDVDVLTLPDATVVGKAADGAAVSGNPVLVAGQDGTNAQSIKTDADGELQVDVLTLPALVAGTANIGDVDVLTMPDVTVVGKAADGAAVSGNPVLIAGQDGTNAQSIKTDAAGELQVDVLTLPALVAGAANIGDVDVLTVPAPLSTSGGGTEAAALRVTLASDSTGLLAVKGDVDHDAVNTLKVVQVGGHASPADVPPALVSASDDRVRSWLDRAGATIMRRRKLRESYTAVFRLAEAAARLDQTFTHVANTNKQWATLHHTGASTKEVRLQSCVAWITSAITAAPQGIIELRQISAAPATGNPAITPTPHRRGGTAAEAICLYLPTTAGTEANVNSPLGHHVFDEAVSVATAAFAHPQGYGRGGIVLYDASLEDDEVMPPVLPVGTLDGWAVVTRLTGATVMRMTVVMKFTEEIP
jgi:hypothetical protein